MTGAETMRTRATEAPSLRTVRVGSGSRRAYEPGPQRVLGPVGDERGRPVEHEEELLVRPLALVVLGNRVTRLELDGVDAERVDAERAPHQDPLAVVPVELVVMPNRTASIATSSPWIGADPDRRSCESAASPG